MRKRSLRLQPAPFDVSRLAPLSSSVQKSLVRLNQQRRSALPCLLPSHGVNTVAAILFPELPAEVHSSLLLDWSRVLSCCSTTEWMGSVCRQSPEDAVARVAKAKSCFCLFYIWKHLASEVDSPAVCIPSTQKSVQKYQMFSCCFFLNCSFGRTFNQNMEKIELG